MSKLSGSKFFVFSHLRREVALFSSTHQKISRDGEVGCMVYGRRRGGSNGIVRGSWFAVRKGRGRAELLWGGIEEEKEASKLDNGRGGGGLESILLDSSESEIVTIVLGVVGTST